MSHLWTPLVDEEKCCSFNSSPMLFIDWNRPWFRKISNLHVYRSEHEICRRVRVRIFPVSPCRCCSLDQVQYIQTNSKPFLPRLKKSVFFLSSIVALLRANVRRTTTTTAFFPSRPSMFCFLRVFILVEQSTLVVSSHALESQRSDAFVVDMNVVGILVCLCSVVVLAAESSSGDCFLPSNTSYALCSLPDGHPIVQSKTFSKTDFEQGCEKTFTEKIRETSCRKPIQRKTPTTFESGSRRGEKRDE